MLGGLLLAVSAASPATAQQRPDAGADAAVSAEWILERLARSGPSRTDFLELRGSRLLREPLRLRGEYRRPEPGTLVREVRAPYAETTTITAGTATIERAGKAPRTFQLTRAPELEGLQAGFGALLAGDRAALAEHYRFEAGGERHRWTLRLLPGDPALAARLRGITLYGRGAELRCIETRTHADESPQRTLLASAARAAGDDASGDRLAALCHGEPAPR